MRTIYLTIRYYWRERIARRIAWSLPPSVAMWAFYRVMTELDPDAGTREQKAVDIVEDWAKFKGPQ